jgi:glycosyltransferase involved in cell wall biosynthesis
MDKVTSQTKDLLGSWALSVYPVSAAYRRRVAEVLGTEVQVSTLAEMRAAGLGGVLRRLRQVRADAAHILLEDPTSTALLPALRFLLALTPCRHLSVVGAEGEVTPFRRRTALRDALRLVGGTVSGALSALLCGLELLSLRLAGGRKRRFRPIRRVAYLKTNLWFGVKAGGSVGHVAGVVNALARRFPHVDVLSVDLPPLLEAGVTHHSVPMIARLGYPYELNYYRYQREFVREGRRLFEKATPDLLYHRLSLANYAGARLARVAGGPYVIEYNGSEVWIASHWGRPLRFRRLARLAEEVALRHADLVVTVSEILGVELRERGIAPERILVHPNCVDADRFDPGRFTTADRAALLSRYGVDEGSVVCGFIGTFGMWHGVTLLADAIRELVRRDEPWVRQWNVHFLIVGDGLLMPNVREILKDPSVARYVTLTGLVEQHEAAGYLAASDVLLSPHVPNADGSPFFGSPTKLFEYMAMARGIVASDLNQIGDVLRRSYRVPALPDGPCRPDEDRLAVLVTPGDRDELLAGLRFLVERPDYRETLGKSARREVLARYTWDRNVDAMLERLRVLSDATSHGRAHAQGVHPRPRFERTPGADGRGGA